MAVAELVPEIPVPDCFTVCFLDPIEARDSAEHRKMARYRIVQSGEKSIDHMDAVSGMNVEPGGSRACANTVWCPSGLESTDNGGSDGDDAAATGVCRIDSVRCCLGDTEDLRVESLVLYCFILDL
jgi:hypothetical protein